MKVDDTTTGDQKEAQRRGQQEVWDAEVAAQISSDADKAFKSATDLAQIERAAAETNRKIQKTERIHKYYSKW